MGAPWRLVINLTNFLALLHLSVTGDFYDDSYDEGYSHDFTKMINDKRSKDYGYPPVPMVVAVVSASANLARRAVIRSTWGGNRARQPHVRLFFVVGQSADWVVRFWVAEEVTRHGDLWVGDFLDTYRNLTLKSGLILERALAQHPTARLVVKMDDDCFLNPWALADFVGLMSASWDQPVIYGKLYDDNRVVREPTEKHYVPWEQFPDEFLPHFVGGGIYILSAAAVTALLPCVRRFLVVPEPFPMEDALVTGICAEEADVPRENRGELNHVVSGFSVEGNPYTVAVHGVTAEENVRLWNSLTG